MGEKENILDHVLTYKGKKYLTLPDAVVYTGMGLTAIHQLIAREKIAEEDYVQRNRYVYITLTECEKLKLNWQKKLRTKKLNKLLSLDIPNEDIDKFLSKMEKKSENK